MAQPVQDLTRIQEIAAEHAAIRLIVGRIERELDRLLDHPAGPDESWELPALARSFDDHLRRHFQLEESGGLLGDARQYYARGDQAEVRRLVAQHRALERRLTRIIDELDSVHGPAAIVQSCFDGEIRLLVAELAAHEAAEDLLLERIAKPQAAGS